MELGPQPTGQVSVLMGAHEIPVAVSVQALPGPHGFPYGLLQNSVLVVSMGAMVGAVVGFLATGALIGALVGCFVMGATGAAVVVVVVVVFAVSVVMVALVKGVASTRHRHCVFVVV